MKLKPAILFTVLIITFSACVQPKTQKEMNPQYTSSITFLYYQDFEYGVDFIENILQLELVMDQGFARVYKVNEKAFLGMVQAKDSTEASGSTLFSLTSPSVSEEYARIKELPVFNLTEMKFFESIPLKSFFFDDKEGHKFEIQEFVNEADQKRF